jgi:hypothetical protein
MVGRRGPAARRPSSARSNGLGGVAGTGHERSSVRWRREMAKVGSNRIRSLRLTPRGAAVQPALAAWRGRAYAQARGVERESEEGKTATQAPHKIWFYPKILHRRKVNKFGGKNKIVPELKQIKIFFFEKHSTNVDTHTRMSTHPYEYTHAHSTPMSTSKRLSRLDLKINEFGHQECFSVNGAVASH